MLTDFPVAQMVKHLPTMQETRVQSLGLEDLLEKEMATHSSILAWKIPWMEEPGRATVHGVTKSWTRLSDFTFMLTEISQTEKYKYYMISLICGIQKIQQTSEYYKQEADSWI